MPLILSISPTDLSDYRDHGEELSRCKEISNVQYLRDLHVHCSLSGPYPMGPLILMIDAAENAQLSR